MLSDLEQRTLGDLGLGPGPARGRHRQGRHLHMAVRKFDVEHRNSGFRLGGAADWLPFRIAHQGEPTRQHLTVAQGIEELPVAREPDRAVSAARPS